MLDPDVPDFAGGDRNRCLALDAMDLGDQFVDGLLAAEYRFVADHDAVDIAMLAGKIDDVAQFALVPGGVLVDPGADGNPQPNSFATSGTSSVPPVDE